MKEVLQWPIDTLARRPVSALLPYARNAKTHPDEQVAKLAAVIREWGWTMPVLMDEDGTIIAGHGRVLAAQRLGLTEVPTIVAVGWSREKCDAYRLADNRLTESPWDADLLALEMRELAERGVDLEALGFDPREITRAMIEGTPIGNTDPDAAPGLPTHPCTRPGDVWILESGYGLIHRVACGDCTDSAIVGAALGGLQPLLMVTDPPYGVKYDANWRNTMPRDNGPVVRARAIGPVRNDDRADWREAWALFPGFVAYVWHSGLQAASVHLSLEAAGFTVRSQIVWIKSHFAIGRGHYHFQHEPMFYATRGDQDHWQGDRYEEAHEVGAYAVRKGKAAGWEGGRKQTTVWQIEKNAANETGHSTQKPVECMRRPMVNNSVPGQPVYDPFLGSGTTVIAGEMTGRPVLAVELDPVYVDVAVERWQKFSGRSAYRESDGAAFAFDGGDHGEATRATGRDHETDAGTAGEDC